MHGGAPEIIEEQVRDRSVRSQIAVLFDRTDIVENKITITTIIVARYTS